MKLRTRWFSERLEQTITVCRWGEIGTPFLMFPTAGGDAEEIERFLVIDTLSEFLEQGRIKVYSCDSVAGKTMITKEGSPEHRMRAMNTFQDFVHAELVPAIREDCRTPDIEIVTAGSSIGAFNALASVCRYPGAFRSALCMSGTYDLQRFIEGSMTPEFYYASPLHYLPDLNGTELGRLQSRFVLLASGRGRAENIGESWKVAGLLGQKGIPNRLDDWGEEWHHDWPTWRNMLVQYVDELVPAAE